MSFAWSGSWGEGGGGGDLRNKLHNLLREL